MVIAQNRVNCVTFIHFCKMHTSLFGCMEDVPLCLFTVCFTPFQMGMNLAHSRDEEYHLCYSLMPASPVWTRADIRKKLNLQQDYFKDSFTYICCLPCAIIQDARELDYIKHNQPSLQQE